MFLTVTLNPALDKTLVVDQNRPQTTVRATAALDLAGGKGLNAARVLRALGAPVRVFLPLGGFTGDQVASLARQEGMEVAAVPVSGQTRTAITLRDLETGNYWHYVEPGPALDDRELSRLREGYLWALDGCHTVLLSGSIPTDAAAPLLAWMVRAAKAREIRVALDSFGPLQRPALEAGPWLAKPNQAEWELASGTKLKGEQDRWAAVEAMADWGTQVAILTLGSAGAIALVNGTRLRVIPPRVPNVNDLGSGDAFLAGYCWAAHAGSGAQACLSWATACAAANVAVWNPGGIERADVERLLPAVQAHPQPIER
jgi:1-phosphofructokinase family hexose kinase